MKSEQQRVPVLRQHRPLRLGAAAITTLSQGSVGDQLVVMGFAEGLACAQRLRELGLTEGKTVVILRAADPVLLALDDSRIAIERVIGNAIEVELAR